MTTPIMQPRAARATVDPLRDRTHERPENICGKASRGMKAGFVTVCLETSDLNTLQGRASGSSRPRPSKEAIRTSEGVGTQDGICPRAGRRDQPGFLPVIRGDRNDPWAGARASEGLIEPPLLGLKAPSQALGFGVSWYESPKAIHPLVPSPIDVRMGREPMHTGLEGQT